MGLEWLGASDLPTSATGVAASVGAHCLRRWQWYSGEARHIDESVAFLVHTTHLFLLLVGIHVILCLGYLRSELSNFLTFVNKDCFLKLSSEIFIFK